jgi:small subunit ribosomal protein S17
MAEETPNENTEETPAQAQAPEAADAPEADETPRAAADAAAAAPSEPEEVLAPKEQRRRDRAAKVAQTPSRGPRSPEERHEDRVALRRQKAQQRRSGRIKARAKAQHTGVEETPPRDRVPGVQKVRQGVVVSDKADKTITVRIDVARRHRRYQKIVRTSNTLHAHDETNDANLGDTVIVREARPLSRSKRWRLVQVVERAK